MVMGLQFCLRISSIRSLDIPWTKRIKTTRIVSLERTVDQTVPTRIAVSFENIAFTLNSSGLKSHGGIAGISGEYLQAAC